MLEAGNPHIECSVFLVDKRNRVLRGQLEWVQILCGGLNPADSARLGELTRSA